MLFNHFKNDFIIILIRSLNNTIEQKLDVYEYLCGPIGALHGLYFCIQAKNFENNRDWFIADIDVLIHVFASIGLFSIEVCQVFFAHKNITVENTGYWERQQKRQ